jgi:hypothetical protein
MALASSFVSVSDMFSGTAAAKELAAVTQPSGKWGALLRIALKKHEDDDVRALCTLHC